MQAFRMMEEQGEVTIEELADAAGNAKTTIRDLVAREIKRGNVENVGEGFVPGIGMKPGKYTLTDKGERYYAHLKEKHGSSD
jgi:predicted transcriptional regulator of viral defense system